MTNQRTFLLGVLTLAVLAPAFALSRPAVPARQTAAPAPLVLGTFDSRAVAAAFLRSARFADSLSGIREEMAAAQAAGDQERIDAIDRQMRERQEANHRQVFCAAPIPEVVAMLAGRLPELAAAAGVDVVVSKWELAYVRPGLAPVDLTSTLVAEFDPDQATRDLVAQIVVTAPLPLSELAEHEH